MILEQREKSILPVFATERKQGGHIQGVQDTGENAVVSQPSPPIGLQHQTGTQRDAGTQLPPDTAPAHPTSADLASAPPALDTVTAGVAVA